MKFEEQPNQDQGGDRIFVSENWMPEERKSLVDLINKKIEELNAEEAHLRETIKWEAPAFKEIDEKRKPLQDLIAKLGDKFPARFLENNRREFGEFVLNS